jgi:hypothetical protein
MSIEPQSPRLAAPASAKRALSFDRRISINRADLRQAFLTWDWHDLGDLTRQLHEKYGESVSRRQLGRLAERGNWQQMRRALTCDEPKTTLSDLYREGKDFDLSKALKGLQARIIKAAAANVDTRDPEYLKSMAEAYDRVQLLISQSDQLSATSTSPHAMGGKSVRPIAQGVTIAPFTRPARKSDGA